MFYGVECSQEVISMETDSLQSFILFINRGHWLLILCCAFYTVWWFASYHPDHSGMRSHPLNIILFILTAVSGVYGIYLIFNAFASSAPGHPLFSGYAAAAAAVILYILSAWITSVKMKRPITTELILITGWLSMEAVCISMLYGADVIGTGWTFVLFAADAAVYILSMAAYIEYYKMPPYKAYYTAAIPLIAVGLAMAVLLAAVYISI